MQQKKKKKPEQKKKWSQRCDEKDVEWETLASVSAASSWKQGGEGEKEKALKWNAKWKRKIDQCISILLLPRLISHFCGTFFLHFRCFSFDREKR